VTGRHFSSFMSYIFEKIKREDPEIFSTDESQLVLPFVGISFILVKPTERYSQNSDRYSLSKKWNSISGPLFWK
jgi:hypothetical protein